MQNKELLQSKKKMMLYIAHNLGSPFTATKESAELLPKIKEKTKQDEYVENICHSSDYMLSLVNTLMEFYLLDTGQIKLHPVFFPLSVFFKETAKNYALLSKKKQLRFTACFSGLDAIVNGDRAHLHQIINNLLSNALKYTDKGTIALDAKYNNEELRFSVHDSGAGITAEDKLRIFNATHLKGWRMQGIFPTLDWASYYRPTCEADEWRDFCGKPSGRRKCLLCCPVSSRCRR